MEKEIIKIKKAEEEPTFPEESDLIIEEILKKYGFWKTQEEEIYKFLESKVSKERKKIFESLPGYKISKVVRKYADGKISLENLPSSLEKELNIFNQKAKKISEELEKKLLIFIKPIKKKKLSLPKIPPAKIKPMVAPPKRPKPPPGPDIYREPIE